MRRPLSNFQRCFPWSEEETSIHVPRGVQITGVLDGQGSFVTVGTFSDLPEGDSPDNIEYDPEHDSRLDKFDAVEFATSRMEKELEAKRDGSKSA